MSKPETDQSPIIMDVAVAFTLLTSLPLPALPESAFAHQARAAWAFGLVGVVVAALAGGLGWGALWLGVPTPAVAGLMLMVQIVICGAMHEDGLADSVDGLWGGWARERQLEIMRDSSIGTYGVLALISSLGLRWVAVATLLEQGLTVTIAALIAAGAVSRGLMPALMTTLPHARNDGLSCGVGRPSWAVVAVAGGSGIAVALAVAGTGAIFPILSACAGVAIVARIAYVRIGGQTGDILGASQQVAEIVMLLGCAATI